VTGRRRRRGASTPTWPCRHLALNAIEDLPGAFLIVDDEQGRQPTLEAVTGGQDAEVGIPGSFQSSGPSWSAPAERSGPALRGPTPLGSKQLEMRIVRLPGEPVLGVGDDELPHMDPLAAVDPQGRAERVLQPCDVPQLGSVVPSSRSTTTSPSTKRVRPRALAPRRSAPTCQGSGRGRTRLPRWCASLP